MVKLDTFSLLVYFSKRFILINVTPSTVDILDKDGFMKGSPRMPKEILHFLALISSDKLLNTNQSQNLSCDSLSFCALCFALKKRNFSFTDILNYLKSDQCNKQILSQISNYYKTNFRMQAFKKKDPYIQSTRHEIVKPTFNGKH